MILAYKIFVNTIAIVIFTYLAQSIFRIHQDKKRLLYFILIAGIATYVPVLLDSIIGMGLRALGVLIILVVLSKILLRISLMNAVISSVLFSIILAVGDITAVLLLVKSYGYTHEMIRSNILLSITADLILYGTAIIIVFIIRMLSQSRDMTNIYKHKMQLRTSFYMLLTFSVVAVNYSMYIKYIGVMEERLVLINVFVMWIYLVLSLYFNFTNSALSLKEQQYDQQQDYIKTIDNLVNEYRRLKHSYANTMYSIYGYIQEDDMPGLKSFFSEIVDETKKMDNNILLALQKIKVYSLFGLLWSKIAEAQSLDISIGVQVSGEIHETGMKLTDLCEVLGNYIDNAIEAALDSEKKNININFVDDQSYLTIRIENTFEGDIDIKKIYEKGNSSKGKDRGYGLSITKQILNRYSNVLHNTFAETGIFRQELVIKK